MSLGTADPNVHLSAKFHQTIQQLFGWKVSALRKRITLAPFTGGGIDDYTDGLDDTDGEAAEVDVRYGDSPHREPNHFRRRLRMRQFDDGKLLDRIDLGKFTPHDPTDAITTMLQASVEKKIERTIIEACYATAYGGQDGTTAYPFDASMEVAVNDWSNGTGTGNTGMTISKLISAREALIDGNDMMDEDLAGDPITAAMSLHEINQLLAYEEVTNGDYVGDARALKDGKVNNLVGVDIVRVSKKRLPTTTGATIRRIPVFFKSGIEARDGQLEAWVRKRDDKKGIPYAYINKFFAATRTNEKKVASILSLI